MAGGEARLATKLEVAGLIRRAAASGHHATVLRKGDPDRGTLLLIIESRGAHVACLERILSGEGYRWQATGPGESASSLEIRDFLAKRSRFDEDGWVLELDIADPQRFIAEMVATG